MTAADVERMLDEAVDDTEFVVGVKAEKLVAGLLEKDPASLDDWLRERAVAVVADALGRRIVATRGRTLSRARARAFGQAAEAADGGDTEPLGHFAVLYVVDADNTRRAVKDMTGPDHKFVAADYGASGRYDLMCEAFHLAVAKKVGARRTAEVLTEEQYDALYQSIARRSA